MVNGPSALSRASKSSAVASACVQRFEALRQGALSHAATQLNKATTRQSSVCFADVASMQRESMRSTSINCTEVDVNPHATARSQHRTISCASCSMPTARATPAHCAAATQKRPSPHPMSISRSAGPAPAAKFTSHVISTAASDAGSYRMDCMSTRQRAIDNMQQGNRSQTR